MPTNKEVEQLTLYDQDTCSGRMSREPSPPLKAKTFMPSSKRPAELSTTPYLYLDLRQGYGSLLGPLWERNSPLLGEYWTLNTGASPKDARESTLSQILTETPHPKYYLSLRACKGILRRVKERGQVLPPPLENAIKTHIKILSTPSA